MRAAVLEQFGERPTVRQVDDPTPANNEVILGVRAAGICRTDLRIIDGVFQTVNPPRVLGHEAAGEVVAIGADVRGVSEGDRVGVAIDVSCGQCPYCRVGKLDYCAQLSRIGIERDGGLAQFVAVPASNLIPLPEAVSFEVGATLADAVGSSYHGIVSRANVRPGETVAIWGLGGLGLNAVQVAALVGASQIIAIARDEGRRARALELGATVALDPRDGDLPERVRELTDGLGVHAFIDIVGTETSLSEALLASRKGGRIVILGYVAPNVVAPTVQMVLKETAILGSRGCTYPELRDAAQLIARGRIQPVIDRVLPLDAVNDALEALKDGTVTGRVVIHP
jgi:D-arabinose 1-dehydrogenase-like Zn-dependent alcohol dehydrogenase